MNTSDLMRHRAEYNKLWEKMRSVFREGFRQFNSCYKYFKDEDRSPEINEDINDPNLMNSDDKDIPGFITDGTLNEKTAKELRIRIKAFKSSLTYCFGINSATGKPRLSPCTGDYYDDFTMIAYDEICSVLTKPAQILKFAPNEERSIVDSLFNFLKESYQRACERFLNGSRRFTSLDERIENTGYDIIDETEHPPVVRSSLDNLKEVLDTLGTDLNSYRWFIHFFHDTVCHDYDPELVKVISTEIRDKTFEFHDRNDLRSFLRHAAGYFAENTWLDKDLEDFFNCYPVYAYKIPTAYVMRSRTALKEDAETLKKALPAISAIVIDDYIRAFIMGKKRMPYPVDLYDTLQNILHTDDAKTAAKLRKTLVETGDKNGVINQSSWANSLKKVNELLEKHNKQNLIMN